MERLLNYQEATAIIDVIYVLSYGYMTRGIFSHFEPFKHGRYVKFTVDEYGDLDNPYFYIDNERDLLLNAMFRVKDGRVITINDFDLREK